MSLNLASIDKNLLLHSLSFLSMQDLQNVRANKFFKDLSDEAWFERAFRGYPRTEGQTAREFFKSREVKPLLEEIAHMAKFIELNQQGLLTIRFNNRRDYIISIVFGCGDQVKRKSLSLALHDNPEYPEGFDALEYQDQEENKSGNRTLVMGAQHSLRGTLSSLRDSEEYPFRYRSFIIIKSVHSNPEHSLQGQIIGIIEQRMQEIDKCLILPFRFCVKGAKLMETERAHQAQVDNTFINLTQLLLDDQRPREAREQEMAEILNALTNRMRQFSEERQGLFADLAHESKEP